MKQLFRIAFGQGLVILATLVPVVSGQHAALAASVFCGSMAGLFLLPLLASVPTRLPGVSESREALSYLRVGAAAVAVVGLVLVITGATVSLLRAMGIEIDVFLGVWRLSDVLIGVLALLVGQGLYVLLVAWYTRQGDMRGIGTLRTTYGVSAIVFALVAVLFGDGFYQVLVASSAALFVSSTITLWVRHRGLRAFIGSLRRTSFGEYTRTWGSGWRISLAGAANGFTAQAAGLVLPALGGLAEAWAIILRVGGGFTTIMQTVVAPFIERDLGAAARARDAHGFRRTLAKGWGFGLVAGTVAAVAGILAAWWTGASTAAETMLPLVLAAGLYFLGQTGTGAISRAVAIAGWQVAQLRWDLARFAIFAVVVVFTGSGLLLAIAASMFVFGVAFALIGLRTPTALRWS